MKETLTTLYNFNSWATGQILESIRKLTPEEYEAPGCSGNGSIRDTLGHMMQAQLGWFSWFDGSMSVDESIKIRISPEEVATQELAKERWRPIDEKTTTFINALSEEDLKKVWSASMPNGFSLEQPLWKLIFHVGNHGTHTRAQILSAIRRAGHDPGNIDMLNYVLTAEKH